MFELVKKELRNYTYISVLPVGCVTESREQVRVDAECFRLELSNTSTDNRSTEHVRSQFDNSKRMTQKLKSAIQLHSTYIS